MLTYISTISTIVLVIITGYYAIITHRILKYQKEITILEYRPFLKQEAIYHKIYFNENENIYHVKIGIKLSNVGRVLLRYQFDEISISIKEIKNSNALFLNNGGYVYPGQTIDFDYSAIEIGDKLPRALEGILKYKLSYFSTKENKHKSCRELLFTILFESDHIEWKSLAEKEE